MEIEGETGDERKARLEKAMKDADLAAAMDAMGTSEPAAEAEPAAKEDAAAAQAEVSTELTPRLDLQG